MQTFVDDAIRIHVTSRRALDEKLEVAVKQLQAVAMRTQHTEYSSRAMSLGPTPPSCPARCLSESRWNGSAK